MAILKKDGTFMTGNEIAECLKGERITATSERPEVGSTDLLGWLRGKITAAESALKAREQMAAAFRSGDDESWASAAAMHPDTAGKPMNKAARLKEADMQTRIAAKCRADLANFQAVLSALSHPNDQDQV